MITEGIVPVLVSFIMRQMWTRDLLAIAKFFVSPFGIPRAFCLSTHKTIARLTAVIYGLTNCFVAAVLFSAGGFNKRN